MAWTYADWTSQDTPAERLARLNAHVSEVSARIDREVNADGKSVASGSLTTYLAELMRQRDKLEDRLGLGGQGVVITPGGAR